MSHLRRVVARIKPGVLLSFRQVEEADSDIDTVGGGNCESFPRRNWIAREQNVPAVCVQLDRALDDTFHRLLPPCHGRRRWDGAEAP